LGGEQQTETSSQPITAADEVYILCVRTGHHWTCAEVTSGTDIASSTVPKPTQFENAENLRLMGMAHSASSTHMAHCDSSTHMAIYRNHRTAFESL
jgi:hypothetical protein